MTSQTANFCIDAADPYAQMIWWNQVLDDFTADPDCAAGDEETALKGPAGRWLLPSRCPSPRP